ncbi:hypothetical protein ACHHYP_00979 [Achlya hypogyna]|uniref:Uncharacterized protein n=1 Tax=Achlya hypogyna TaxID=1202772 RepID=A0A1V9Z9L0_ACHHY|nr:hypothetical protein ACHHYP_00979 [Achlya hypogyna]
MPQDIDSEMSWSDLREHYSLQPMHRQHTREQKALQIKQQKEWQSWADKHSAQDCSREPVAAPSAVPDTATRQAFEMATLTKECEFRVKALARQQEHELAALTEKHAFSKVTLAERERFEMEALAEKHKREIEACGEAWLAHSTHEEAALQTRQMNESIALDLRQKTELASATEAAWIEHAVEDFLAKDPSLT